MAKIKVLYVEDDDISAFIFRKLTSSIFDVTHFTDPLTAINNCSFEDFDLIFTDAYMPVMNGFEFLRHMQGHNIKVPVFFCSSSVFSSDVENARSFSQVVDFLSKPVRMDHLIEYDLIKDRVIVEEVEVTSTNGEITKKRVVSLKD